MLNLSVYPLGAHTAEISAPLMSILSCFFEYKFENVMILWVTHVLWSFQHPNMFLGISEHYRKNSERAPRVLRVRAHILKIDDFDFRKFGSSQISNYHIWPANLWILLRPEYVATLCKSYRPDKRNWPNCLRRLEIHMKT